MGNLMAVTPPDVWAVWSRLDIMGVALYVEEDGCSESLSRRECLAAADGGSSESCRLVGISAGGEGRLSTIWGFLSCCCSLEGGSGVSLVVGGSLVLILCGD